MIYFGQWNVGRNDKVPFLRLGLKETLLFISHRKNMTQVASDPQSETHEAC